MTVPIILFVAIVLSLVSFYVLPTENLYHTEIQRHRDYTPNSQIQSLLHAQNETIRALREELLHARTDIFDAAHVVAVPSPSSANPVTLGCPTSHSSVPEDYMREMRALKDKLAAATLELSQMSSGSGGGGERQEIHLREQARSSPDMSRTSLDADCEARLGLGLTDAWRASQQEWCRSSGSSSSSSQFPSSIRCYPYEHHHKKGNKNRQTTDMFCEGTNIFIDFSRVAGKHGGSKPSRGQSMYHRFDQGSTFATCEKTEKWRQNLFMPHAALQMNGFKFGASVPAEYVVEDSAEAVYLLARDEDCENLFHSSADHINLFNVAKMLGLDFDALKVILFDRHTDGPFFDLIQTAFSPKHKLSRAADYGGKTVLFPRLVWHLESPAGIVFPKVGGPKGLTRCHDSTLWHEFRAHVLKAFDLWDVPPPPVPQVLISFRRRTKSKNVGRVIANEGDLVDVLKQGDMLRYEVVDMSTLSFREQLQKVRSSNVYVGAHGAGLMHVIFMAEEGVLLEIHPSYRLDRHFRLAARMAGKIYMPMRSTSQVACSGSSDSIPVDKDDFARVLDGAIRLARSFDDGASECGLRCDPRILAIDSGNDAHYQDTGTKKGTALSTRFPC